MFRFDSIPKIYLACDPVDLRKSIDGLALIVQSVFELDPFQDALFIFTNRSHTRLKCLCYDRNGFWLLYKRLNKGSFPWHFSSDGAITLSAEDFERLLNGFDICPRSNFAPSRPWGI